MTAWGGGRRPQAATRSLTNVTRALSLRFFSAEGGGVADLVSADRARDCSAPVSLPALSRDLSGQVPERIAADQGAFSPVTTRDSSRDKPDRSTPLEEIR